MTSEDPKLTQDVNSALTFFKELDGICKALELERVPKAFLQDKHWRAQHSDMLRSIREMAGKVNHHGPSDKRIILESIANDLDSHQETVEGNLGLQLVGIIESANKWMQPDNLTELRLTMRSLDSLDAKGIAHTGNNAKHIARSVGGSGTKNKPNRRI